MLAGCVKQLEMILPFVDVCC